MAAYATVQDVEARTVRTFTQAEEAVMAVLLEDAAVLIDAAAPKTAPEAAKKTVSCRMVLRAMGDEGGAGIPMGATQGTVTAGPYSQTWTVGSGSVGELYLTRADRTMLGAGDRMGAANPLLAMVPEAAQPYPEPDPEPDPEPEPQPDPEEGGEDP